MVKLISSSFRTKKVNFSGNGGPSGTNDSKPRKASRWSDLLDAAREWKKWL